MNIDRLNAFYWPQIKGFIIDENGDTNCLFGYSRYTDKTYMLERIDKQSDFVRHSMPADSFFSGSAFPGTSEIITLSPYVKNATVYEIKNTQVTLYPYQGFIQFNLEGRDPAKVVIHGVDIRGNATTEEISFVASMNYVTDTEWKLITGFVLYGMAASADIIFYPYIAGDIALSSDLIITRQHLEPGPCILTVDKAKKDLVFNILRENYAEYPLKFDIIKTVPLGMKADHSILSYYIDESNKLVYAIHGKLGIATIETIETVIYTEHTFSCYPLIIPTTPNNTLDAERTSYQAVSIEYEEDCIAEVWDMWIFPTSKTNDVETLNISINGEEYISGMLLELLRYDIQTNRITIPFADIYTDELSSALVEIETYGAERSYIAFTLDRTILQPLYNKDLDNYLKGFKKTPDDIDNWSLPIVSSTNVPYKGGDLIGWGEGKYGGLTETLPEKPVGFGGAMDINYLDHYEMYRLSSTANVAVNGQKIVNIFNSFYADEASKYIISSDTITHIKGASCMPAPAPVDPIEFNVVLQSPLDIMSADGIVNLTFDASVDVATIPSGINILGPSPWTYPGVYPI